MPFASDNGIFIAQGEHQVNACFTVMAELRPHLDAAGFADRVRAQGVDGYQLACQVVNGKVVTVAGFRTVLNLAWGRFLYVDDLVTAATQRGHGHGGRMLDWLKTRARETGCDALHLDSGLQRLDAHRFYEAHHLSNTSLHFAWGVGE